MPKNKKKADDKTKAKMFSIRKDQHDRVTKLATKEKRSLRAILDRALDKYEGIE